MRTTRSAVASGAARSAGTWHQLGSVRALRLPPPEAPVGTLAVLHGWRHSASYMAQRCRRIADRFDVWCLEGPVVLEVGRTWFEWVDDDLDLSVERVHGVTAVVRQALRALPRPLAVLGYSQGGFVGANAVLREPGLADALVVLKNALVELVAPDEVADDPRNRALPAMLVVSDEDPVGHPEVGRASAARLQDLGLDLTLAEGDPGHDLTDRELDLAASFLLETRWHRG